ncbi:protein dispatched homolog 1-like [Diadema setosum]|uniref:protein dispatched homolog 1-like n=1 Tax=Diadema setosum TaxID=31175 RepID=UPI003B3B37FD
MALSSSMSSSVPPPPTVQNAGAPEIDGPGVQRRKFSISATLAKFYWNYPVFFCLLEFVVVMSLGALVVIEHGFPKFDDASVGIESRGTEIKNRLIPLEILLRKDDDILTISPRNLIQSVSSASVESFTQPLLPVSPMDKPPPEPKQPSKKTTSKRPSEQPSEQPSTSVDSVNICGNPAPNGFRIVFQQSSSQSRLLTPESLISMCRHDDVIVRKTTHFQAACALDGQGSCCATWSVANYVALLANKSSCYHITQGDVNHVNKLLLRCAPFYSSGQLRAGCSTSRNCVGIPLECTEWDAIYSIFFYLTPSEFDSDAVNEGAINLQMTLHVYPLSDRAAEVRSIFLDNIHGRTLDDGITKVLGIGVDILRVKLTTYSDILHTDFVYIGLGGAVVTAIIWLHMESIFVTVMFLLQMALSLILGYFFHYIVFDFPFFPLYMMLLTIILVIAIGADDAFIFHDILRENQRGSPVGLTWSVVQKTLEEASATMFVTSFTSASALFVTATSSLATVRVFGIYSGMVILCNYILTVLWLPPAVIIGERYFKRICIASSRFDTIKYLKIRIWAAEWSRRVKGLFKRVFRVHLPKGVFKLRFLWLPLFSSLIVVSFVVIFVSPRLTLPTRGGLQLYQLSHPLEMYEHVLMDEFDFERAKSSNLPIIVVWGVVPIDNGNHWDPYDRGYLVMDKSFNLLQQDSQEWLLAFCSSVRNQSFYQDSVYEDCFVESLKEFLEEPCADGSAEAWRFPCCGKTHDDFPYPPDLFQECTEKLMTLRCAPGFCSSVMPGPRFDANNSITALIVQFKSSVLERFEYKETKIFWDDASSWVSSQLASAPPGLQSGWFVTIGEKQPYFLDNTLSFANGAVSSLGYSILIAAVVILLTTRNFVILVFVVLSIGGAVATTLACLVCAGWELNVFEASILALIVGLSVDFTLHYGVAYLRASGVGRSARSEHAISTLSSANTMAALSSFMAGAMMLPATVLAFRQLGIALQVTMVSSWSFGIFFFIPLCRVIGPEADCGQLGPLLVGLCRRCRQSAHDISNMI